MDKTYPGLYRPEFEKDSCGFGLIAQMDGIPSHWLVRTAISSLACLTHRGAIAADGKTGDGCGLLLKKPDEFLRAIATENDIKLAPHYAVGMVFLNQEARLAKQGKERLEQELAREGLHVEPYLSIPMPVAMRPSNHCLELNRYSSMPPMIWEKMSLKDTCILPGAVVKKLSMPATVHFIYRVYRHV